MKRRFRWPKWLGGAPLEPPKLTAAEPGGRGAQGEDPKVHGGAAGRGHAAGAEVGEAAAPGRGRHLVLDAEII